MQALVLRDFNTLEVQAVPDAPPPVEGEVRIRIAYTGICGSDIHGYTGENGRRCPGQVMGHESVGRVESLGPGAAQHGVVVGQTVTFNPVISCQECTACRAGRKQHCAERVVIGVAPDVVSAFAQLITLPVRNVVPLDGMRDERHGALVEPLAVAMHAAHRAGIGPGDTVLVAGGGPIGQSCVLAALRLGSGRVLATDLAPGRRALLERLGAEAIDPGDGPVADQVIELLGGPVDVTLDAVGVSSTISDGLLSTRIGGTVCLVGMGAPEVTVPAYQISTQERSLVGSFVYDVAAFHDAAAWVGEGHAVFDELISDTVSLEDADAAFRRLADSAETPGKVLVDLRTGG
jgi:threonine dehydrogenase-like Zn-dependent dehydrogenase